MGTISTYHLTLDGEGNILVSLEGALLLDESGQTRTWGSEKTALQWLRRKAQASGAKFVVFKLDQSSLCMDYAEDPLFRMGKHNFEKVNIVALGDRLGPYDKLVCSYCHKVARRYRAQRHFREELESCEKNLIPVERVE